MLQVIRYQWRDIGSGWRLATNSTYLHATPIVLGQEIMETHSWDDKPRWGGVNMMKQQTL
jgi:hypothetical protein